MPRNKIVTVTGEVVSQITGRNSKSEHEAVVLKTGKKDYILRRRGGNPFLDPEMKKLIGKRIQAKGEVVEYVFFIEDWEEL